MQPGCQPGYQPKEDSMKKALLILAAAATLSPLGAGAQGLCARSGVRARAAAAAIPLACPDDMCCFFIWFVRPSRATKQVHVILKG